jgi:DNA invertase Pin-like site-specific DNA recombinase
MSRRAAVYVRISRDKVGAGLGVERQEADCRKLAADLGWEVVGVYPDNDLSAYSGKPRPRYRELLAAIRAGQVDAVLVWHTDRLHRSPAELEEYIAVCQPRDVPTVTVKAGALDLATPTGRAVARTVGAWARFEVEHMAERQQRARLQAATDGRWSGGRRPFGYGPDGTTVIPVEAAEVRTACAEVLAGRSLRAIAADMNARGSTTSTGKPWRSDSLRDVLLRPRNAGRMVHRGQVVGEAGWPALVDLDTWMAVVGVLTDPSRRTNPGRGPRWLLSGIATCSVCGAPVRSTSASGRPTYTCSSGKHVVRSAGEVDAYVAAVILERLGRPDARELLAPNRAVDTAELHLRDTALRERLDGLAAAYADGAIDGRQLREGTERIRAQRAEVEAQLAANARGSVLAGVVDAPDPAAVWRGLDLDRRRAVVQVLVEVVIHPARRGRRPGWQPGESYFDPRTVQVTPKRG